MINVELNCCVRFSIKPSFNVYYMTFAVSTSNLLGKNGD